MLKLKIAALAALVLLGTGTVSTSAFAAKTNARSCVTNDQIGLFMGTMGKTVFNGSVAKVVSVKYLRREPTDEHANVYKVQLQFPFKKAEYHFLHIKDGETIGVADSFLFPGRAQYESPPHSLFHIIGVHTDCTTVTPDRLFDQKEVTSMTQ